MSLASLLCCCHLCGGFLTKWRRSNVGATEPPSVEPKNMVGSLLCLLAIVVSVLTLPSPPGVESIDGINGHNGM